MTTLVVCSQCEKLNRVSVEKLNQTIPVCGNCKSELSIREGVQEISSNGLNKLIQNSDVPVVVDFWAEWCGPCKAFAPVFKSTAKDLLGQMVFAKLNTEEFPDAAQAYQIRGIPTLIVFKNGKEVDRQSGALPGPVLMRFLSQWR